MPELVQIQRHNELLRGTAPHCIASHRITAIPRPNYFLANATSYKSHHLTSSTSLPFHHHNQSHLTMPPPPQEENKQASANTAVNILQEISEILVSSPSPPQLTRISAHRKPLAFNQSIKQSNASLTPLSELSPRPAGIVDMHLAH